MIGTKILFLEDDTLYQETIKEFLEEEEFIVDTCTDGEEFLNKIFENVYDLYILDINVPKIDGMKILKILKEYNDNTMKLVLTSTQNSLINSFKIGCDDFLNKRCDIDELLLRIKMLIRRAYKAHKEYILLGNNIKYDLFNKKIYKNEHSIKLEIRSLLILDYLIKRRGEYVSNNELENKTYSTNTNSKSDVIRYHIWHLRKILGKNLIESKKSFGYRLKLEENNIF
ncbi:response regulator transcription factor [Halarcobacter ebronensis]|uniref:Helix-turn-helix domain-containing protein n=1 Tax=Halarcobacter ebronensis TaxID=1462615 RepID=A0A4Q1AVN7_9BACT|nr:response regulator transcription factor [Halarcobacter ebronensis]QKF82008.1 signal transduction response regulator [Halarcobacter ebronensis]RXK04280.1 helix-turn-helix domain-containing protein [Halarcobacter ebronensis]